MFQFLGCFFVLGFFLLIIALSLGFRFIWAIWHFVGRIFGAIFGVDPFSSSDSRQYGHHQQWGQQGNQWGNQQSQRQSQSGTASSSGASSTSTHHSRVFEENEGEYVDFEEVKD